jgi:simple sugar transport system ATP-binding protein
MALRAAPPVSDAPPVPTPRGAVGGSALAGVAVGMAGISRRFGTTVALDDVDLELRGGEIHALLGENGAGKTTLMRILAGLDRPDAGTVAVGGEVVDRFDPRALRDRGVAMVQQHFTLVPTLTAGQNLVLGCPERALLPSARAAAARVDALVARYGLAVRTGVPAGQLSVGEQQRLELLRALDAGARVLVLDEPTAVLTDAEADVLLATCRGLADEGRSVVVITHRLAEVMAGCDRVTVLRAGRVVLAGAPVAVHTRAGLASLMVGTEHRGEHAPRTERHATDRMRLRLTGITHGLVRDLSLTVHGGEVLGVAGVDGNGQADLEAVLAGRAVPSAGTVELDGVPLAPGDPARRVGTGLAYIPSDRYRHGLVRALPLSDNLELGRVARWRPRRRRRLQAAAPKLARWDVRTAGPAARAASLSGGNAQKVVLARELAVPGAPAVVACYPTRGLDPEASRVIVARVLESAAAGAAGVWIGAELDELRAVADRIVVMTGGRLLGPFSPPYVRADIGLAMAGVTA